MGNKIRVLVVDDSSLMRLIISDILNNAGGIEVVGTAIDGKDAYEKVLELKPDIITLDLIMGAYDGLYAVKKIMKNCPTPIVLVSVVDPSYSEAIITALEMGAFDYISKPKGVISGKIRTIHKEITAKVREAAKVNVDTLIGIGLAKKLKEKLARENVAIYRKSGTSSDFNLLAIGASTGGTAAIEHLLLNLDGKFTIPIVIGQHMPPEFAPSFVQRLDSLFNFNVHVGSNGTVLKKSNVYVCPSNFNMGVTSTNNLAYPYRIEITQHPEGQINNPSINFLFHSVAETAKAKGLGVILTGMGEDGADGIHQMSNNGSLTIAQNEESCVVFGMPKAAVHRGGINEVMHLDNISNFLISCQNSSKQMKHAVG